VPTEQLVGGVDVIENLEELGVDTLEVYTSRNPSTMVFQLAASGIVTLRVRVCSPKW